MNGVQPYWIFIAGLLLLAVFAFIMIPSRRSHYRPSRPSWIPGMSQHLLGPGGTRHLYEGFFDAGATFYMFGVDWCPHCKTAKPEFERLGSTMTIGETSVKMRYVNPENEKEAAQGFAIEGYPTFYLEKGGQKIKYAGPRSTAGFQEFLQKNLSA